MRKLLLSIIIILMIMNAKLYAQETDLGQSEIKVKKVLETKSIKEYNQWVMRSKIEYPALKHIKVTSKSIVNGEEYKVFYYIADGSLFKEEVIKAKPGMWLGVHVEQDVNRVVTTESSGLEGGEGVESTVTARDSRGNVTCSFISSGAGLFAIPSIGFFTNNIATGLVEVVNWEGDKIGEFVSTADYYEFGRMEYVSTPDDKYVLLSFMMGSPHVALWEKSEGIYRELWQKQLNSYVFLSISHDGQYSCIGDSGCVFVYNSSGTLSYTFCFSKRGRTNPHSDFSPDGNFLVCALSSHMALIDNKTGKPVWEIQVDGDALMRQVFFVKNGEYIVLTHVSVEKAYIYDLQGTLQATIDNVFGCSAVDDLIICGNAKAEFNKTIYQISKE